MIVSRLACSQVIAFEMHQVCAVAWSSGDTEALAGMATEDAVRVGAFGEIQYDR